MVYATYVLALTIAPVLFLTGLQGAFFSPLALAFLLAVLASLAVAIIVTPALAALLLRRLKPHEEPRLLLRAKAWHRGLLERITVVPDRVVVLTAIVGAGALARVLRVRGRTAARVSRAALCAASRGADRCLARLDAHDRRADVARIAEHSEIATVEQQIGRAEAGEDTWPPNRSEFHIE